MLFKTKQSKTKTKKKGFKIPFCNNNYNMKHELIATLNNVSYFMCRVNEMIGNQDVARLLWIRKEKATTTFEKSKGRREKNITD